MPAPESVIKLVENFHTHLDHYKSSGYNETEVRREYLDPFWKALGWDIDNEQGYADAYKDVIHEDAIKIGGYTKAPDYCFRIGGTRKFFLEAKKPAVDLKADIAPAYQLRRYAWSGKLPLSVLSDFEELAVYDCRVKPVKTDKASTARILYFTYDQYAEKWDEIASIFSREAVLKGSFDKYAETSKKKRGTAEVDDAFLEEIERWRELLARNLALRNPALTVRDLNYAVQKIIDRLIFLRICEDRGTEDYGRLQALTGGNNIYPRLVEQFHAADDRYNSGLFHLRDEKGRAGAPDTLTPGLSLDDKALKDILKNLYYPDSPYEFSVLPADILGQVYEQFLGKTIRLTDSHQAKIEEKPEVRKAGGVYYTPAYIVDYIVENTLGRLLNGEDPDNKKPIPVSQAEKLKVLDPACGSGSFLIVAYQYLLDWHRDQYTIDPETSDEDEGKIKRHSGGNTPKIYQAKGGEWKLTTTERKRILLNNIHGVDIDSQAVEVTKLSLLLKVLEGETQQKLQRDFIRERQRILPDLGHNIQCGNSLIGPDFYDQPDFLDLDDDTRYRINVFDWETAFPGVFEQGGFDCVVGNPPYLAGRVWTDTLRAQKPYFEKVYSEFTDQYDLYALFIERGLELTSEYGRFAYITPNTWLNNDHYYPLRSHVLKKSSPVLIGDFREVKVFADATVLPIVFIASRSFKPNANATCVIETFQTPHTSKTFDSSPRIWDSFPKQIFNLSISQDDLPALKKIANHASLETIADCRFGVKVYQKGKGKPKQTGEESKAKIFESTSKKADSYLPYARGRSISRWRIDSELKWLNYGTHLAEPRSIDLFTGPRIFLRRIVGERLILFPTEDRIIADQLLHTIKPKDGLATLANYQYLSGILASQLIAYFFRKSFNRTEKLSLKYV
jgi:hypothetical protein